MAQPLKIATRGSALALAQAYLVEAECRKRFPGMDVEICIIKTTGDKLQTASLSNPDASLPRGLFTKELEVALLNGEADVAVHSLKDLPTELPSGLFLGATLPREDVRDVLLTTHPEYQSLSHLPEDGWLATSSNRRAVQVQHLKEGIRIFPVRGNVGTRLQKLVQNPEWAGMLLAYAGLNRLQFKIDSDHRLTGQDVPPCLYAYPLALTEMLPAVGQGAIGLEIRREPHGMGHEICELLNDWPTFLGVTAERAFLRAMGGGCQSPVAALGTVRENVVRLQGISYMRNQVSSGETSGSDATEVGEALARKFLN